MHEHHNIVESDELFDNGTLYHLVPGNQGRVLDGRRTPGYIESFDIESCMFVWRITDFEDKGKCWVIPAEQIGSYQFRKGSKLLDGAAVEQISNQCEIFKERLNISCIEENLSDTESLISEAEKDAEYWLQNHSHFLKNGKRLDLSAEVGNADLYCDLENYLSSKGLLELEKLTAEQYLLNPYSGEWIKGMKIVMAELGLINYNGTIPRSSSIFTGSGSKALRKQYIISRCAFLRAIFKYYNISEVPLYRGVASPMDFYETPITLLSTTFSADMAKEFASINDSTEYRSCYWAKFTIPIKNLFMTFLETKEFNERYKEQEAIVFYRK